MTVLIAVGGLTLACGGRGSAHPVTTPGQPPISVRPSRLSEITKAVRLDQPSTCEEDCQEATDAGRSEAGLTEEGRHVTLQPGMTLYSLAHEYGVSVHAILEANGIDDPRSIPAGTEIYLPAQPVPEKQNHRSLPNPHPSTGRTTRAVSPTQDPSDGGSPALMALAWPLSGRITGHFGQRSRHHHHDGIDIDGTRGEEVRAVAPGIVVRSGSDGNYGRTVVIDHGDGLTTLYAHASRLLVSEGDRVDSGQAIAEVGATGNAHGTHLHFEVRRDGRPVDPLSYFKPEIIGPSAR